MSMWLEWLATKTTGALSPSKVSRPSVRRRTYQAMTGAKKPERIVSRANRAGAQRAHGMSRAAHLISRPRSRALRAVWSTRSWAASRLRGWSVLFSAMPASTPGSHPGYHRYLPRRAAGWYDLRMADEREHPAQPQQSDDEGFAEGQEQIHPESPDQERVRDFGEGQELTPDAPEEEHIGRFSEGQEEEGETPEKVVERDFAEGQEDLPPGEA